jgi:antitoxin HicB
MGELSPWRSVLPLLCIEGIAFAAGGGNAVPDLPGCISDGETPEEALANVRDAVASWIDEARALGRAVPEPSRRHAAAV